MLQISGVRRSSDGKNPKHGRFAKLSGFTSDIANMPKIFNIKELMSRTPEILGEVDWLSRQGFQVFCDPLPEGKLKLTFSSDSLSFKNGDTIYLQGIGFGVDGFYEIRDFDGEYCTCTIDSKYDRMAQATVYTTESYPVYYVDKLGVESTLEFKRLREVDRFSIEMRQTESAAKAQSAMELINLLKIDIETGDVDEEAVKALVQDDPAKFLSQIKSLDFGVLIDLKATKFDLQEVELKKIERRELEILCQMPRGHMDLMNNLPEIDEAIAQIYGEVARLTTEATQKKMADNVEPESEDAEGKLPKNQSRSRKPKSSTTDISQAS